MSTIIHPRHGPTGKRHPLPVAGGQERFWVGMAIATLVVLTIGIIGLRPKRARDLPTAATTRDSDVVAVRERQPTPVGIAPDNSPPAEQPRAAEPYEQTREFQVHEFDIRAVQSARMQKECIRNEFLPPEERSPLAPTAAMIQTFKAERGNLQ